MFAGSENDSIQAAGNSGAMQLFGNEGADTVDTSASSAAQTIVGGDNSSDGNDTILAGSGADLIFGNGGNDTVAAAGGANTVYSGVGNDSIAASGAGLYFGNQGGDTINVNDPRRPHGRRRQQFGGRRRLRQRQQFQ